MLPPTMSRHLVLALLALSTACAPRPDSNPPPVHLDCNVIGQTCLLPWPSSVFAVADATAASGVRLDPSDQASFAGLKDALFADPPDGFSAIGSIATFLPAGGSVDDLPSEYLASVREDSPVVLVDADATSETYGRRMPFQAQLVDAADGSGLLVLTPLEPFAPKGRYAVVITDGLRDGSGEPLEPTETMSGLLGQGPVDDGLEELADYYGDLVRLARVELDIPPARIVQMWDFHVRSDEELVDDLVSMAGQAETWMEENPPVPQVAFEERAVGHDRFSFFFDVPLWHADRFDPLNRDGDGRPAPVGELQITGYMLVPDSATEQTPATPLLFGHGLGVHSEQMMPTIGGFDLDAGPFAIVAFDWDLHGDRGQALDDIVDIAGSLNFDAFSAAMLQSSIDQLVATVALENMPELPDRGRVVVEGPVFYLGQSMGSLVGVIAASINPRLAGSVFNVAGGGLSNILRLGEVVDRMGMREALEYLVEQSPPDDLPPELGYDVILVVGQVGLDVGDPINYAQHVRSDRLVGEAHPVLVQESMYDGVVPNVTTEALARQLELVLIEPAQLGAPGLERAQAPTCGAPAEGLVQFLISDVPFVAHMALEEEEVAGQATDWFASWLDDDPGNDGNISLPGYDGACP